MRTFITFLICLVALTCSAPVYQNYYVTNSNPLLSPAALAAQTNTFTGTIKAQKFLGDGSLLTGISAASGALTNNETRAVTFGSNVVVSANLTVLGTSNYLASMYAPTGSVTTVYATDLEIGNPWNAGKGTNLMATNIVGTFNQALLTTASTATNGPANNELVAAQFVRELFAGFGVSLYSTTNSDVTFTNSDIVTQNTTVYQFSPVVGDYAVRTYTTPTNNEYIGQVVTTNRYLQLNAGVTVNAYLESTDGFGTAGPSLKPEVYVSYDKTNWLGDWDATAQYIPEGATNLYTWVVSNPSYTSTNANGFYVQRRFKIVAQTTPAAANVKFHLGTGKPSHITLSAADSTSGNVYLTTDNSFVASNSFNGPVYLSRSPSMGTNSWALDRALPMNTNKLILSSGAVTGGITNVENVYPVGSQFGELLIKATGDITFTNPAAWVTSDMVDSRIITNGNYAQIAVEVTSLITNLIIVQSK